MDDRLKALHIETTINANQTSSRVGDSGYMSIQGLPCTNLTQHNLLEISSQVAETEIGEEPSEITQSDLDIANEFGKSSVKIPLFDPKSNVFEPNAHIYDKKINLYEPKTTYTKNEIFAAGNMRLLETQLKSNVVDESMMSTASSVWGEDRDLLSVSGSDWEVPSTQVLEQLSNAGNKGSHRSEVQLR